MNTPNDRLLRERSLAFLIRAADQLVRAERTDILASEGIRRHDLRLLHRLTHRGSTQTRTGDDLSSPDSSLQDTASADGPETAAGDILPDAQPADVDPTNDDPRHGRHPRGNHRRGPHARARLGGFRLRHLLMRGWVTLADGYPTITVEGARALARIDDRLTESRARIESALTPEQLTAVTDGLSAIVEELGGTDRLREVRRRRRLMQQLREGGSRHGFGRRGFGERGMHGAHVGLGAHAEFHEGGGCVHRADDADSQGYRGRPHHGGFRDGHGHAGLSGRHEHDGLPGRHGHDGFPSRHGHRRSRDAYGHDGFPSRHGHNGPRDAFEHGDVPGRCVHGDVPDTHGAHGDSLTRHGGFPGGHRGGRRHHRGAGHHGEAGRHRPGF
ncbi:hypothetical protein [Microbacterium nymphoidis]|uniref:hypothetical protein n=1 Tax=Microbacterium nymphoidis TaxID=2898586 RepID=UPI001E5517A9|nr:hypothetical protein [Microbacterium nymphoidis]MCD2499595.1 hypothetical protein [Microbacterium nymphoidis]